jgi:hypothetical protein
MAQPPRSAREIERELRALLGAPRADSELRTALEELAREPAFPGLTWLWGPRLHERNRVLFRPFILAHLSSWSFDPPARWRAVPWSGEREDALERWLAAVDRDDDIPLFRRLCSWKHSSESRLAEGPLRSELLARLRAASSASERATVLAKYDLGFQLDEESALELFRIDPRATRAFLLRHLPGSFWSRDRTLWARLSEAARAVGDEELAFALYRRQAPLERWEADALDLCRSVADPARLAAELERRHPDGYGIDLGASLHRLALARGRDVLPYLVRHLRQVWSGWLHHGYDDLLDLARERGWWDLWAALLRVCARPAEFNRELARLLERSDLDEPERRERLLALAGVSREWNLPGLGVAFVHPLEEKVALSLYRRFPDLLRGPFKLHVQSSYAHAYPKLTAAVIEAKDDALLDFLASRLLTRAGPWLAKGTLEVAEEVSRVFESLRERDRSAFALRAANVLSQVPAYTIASSFYDTVIRENRLARLLLERSAGAYLEHPRALRDLCEASEIHVQVLAYRALGVDDERARALAAENLDLLLGTLLRPLHRRTRLLAFRALANAARHDLTSARRVLDRARQALDLPDLRYPKEGLIGLIGQLLHRWPDLRGPREQRIVYGAALAGEAAP